MKMSCTARSSLVALLLLLVTKQINAIYDHDHYSSLIRRVPVSSPSTRLVVESETEHLYHHMSFRLLQNKNNKKIKQTTIETGTTVTRQREPKQLNDNDSVDCNNNNNNNKNNNKNKQIITCAPTASPTAAPTTAAPTQKPTDEPTKMPTKGPTMVPTSTPTEVPTNDPTDFPTMSPTKLPTKQPTVTPGNPTLSPTRVSKTWSPHFLVLSFSLLAYQPSNDKTNDNGRHLVEDNSNKLEAITSKDIYDGNVPNLVKRVLSFTYTRICESNQNGPSSNNPPTLLVPLRDSSTQGILTSPQNAGLANGNQTNIEHYTNYNHYKYIDFCSKDEKKNVYDLTVSRFPLRRTILIADDMHLHNDDNFTVIIEDRESSEETNLQWLQWTFQVNILQLGSNWNGQVAQFEKQTQSYVISHLTLPKDENSTPSIIANVTALGSEVTTFSKILDDYYSTADKNTTTNSTTGPDTDTGTDNDSDTDIDTINNTNTNTTTDTDDDDELSDQGLVKAIRTRTFLPLNTSRVDGTQITGIIFFLMAVGIMYLLVTIAISRREKRKIAEKNFKINLLEINDDTGLGFEQILDSSSESEVQSIKQFPLKMRNPENDNNIKGQSRLLSTLRRKQKQIKEENCDDKNSDTFSDEEDFMVLVTPKQSYSLQQLKEPHVTFASSTPATVVSSPGSPVASPSPRSPLTSPSPRSPLASPSPRSPLVSPLPRSPLASPQVITLELDEDEDSIINQISNTAISPKQKKSSYLKKKLAFSKKGKPEEDVENNFDEENFIEQVIISPKQSSSP